MKTRFEWLSLAAVAFGPSLLSAPFVIRVFVLCSVKEPLGEIGLPAVSCFYVAGPSTLRRSFHSGK